MNKNILKKISLGILPFIALVTSCQTVMPINQLNKEANETNALTGEVKTSVLNFFSSSNNLEFVSKKTYAYSSDENTITDAVSSTARFSKVVNKNGETESEAYYLKSGNYTTQQYLDIDNTIFSEDVTDSSGNKVAFDTLTGNPFSFLTSSNFDKCFIGTSTTSGIVLTPTEYGTSKLNVSFNSFFAFDDSYTYDTKTLSEYVDNFKLELNSSNTPTKMSFTKVKKDMFGAVREYYVTDINKTETVATLQPVTAKTTGDTYNTLNTALSALKTSLSGNNFTQTVTVDQWDMETISPGYQEVTYNTYYQFDNSDYSIMLSDLKLSESTYGTTYIGIVPNSSGDYQWIGVSPSSNYMGSLDSDTYDSFLDFVAKAGNISTDFFSYTNNSYVFDIESLYEADHTFQVSLLTALVGGGDYLAQKWGNYISSANTMRFDFQTLTINLNSDGSFKNFVLVYKSLDGNEHSMTVSYSNIGETDISKVTDLADAFSVIKANI